MLAPHLATVIGPKDHIRHLKTPGSKVRDQSPFRVYEAETRVTIMTTSTPTRTSVIRSAARLRDRAEAGRLVRDLMGGPVSGRVVVGIGPGGFEVARAAAAGREHVARLDVEEFDLPDPLSPGHFAGAVDGAGHVLLREAALGRSDLVRARLGKVEREAGDRMQRPASRRPLPVRDRDVVLVDDGSSAPSKVAAALDFVRRFRPLSVAIVVACAPPERKERLAQLVGAVSVAFSPAWADWFDWHGILYQSDLDSKA